MKSGHKPDGAKKVVYAALLGNLAIAVTKGVAAFVTGSSGMLSEAIHSFVDTGNEVLLLHGMRRARRGPDRTHPLGYGREALPPSRDVINNDGDVVVPIDLRNFGNWLKLFMGQPTTTTVGGAQEQDHREGRDRPGQPRQRQPLGVHHGDDAQGDHVVDHHEGQQERACPGRDAA